MMPNIVASMPSGPATFQPITPTNSMLAPGAACASAIDAVNCSVVEPAAFDHEIALHVRGRRDGAAHGQQRQHQEVAGELQQVRASSVRAGRSTRRHPSRPAPTTGDTRPTRYPRTEPQHHPGHRPAQPADRRGAQPPSSRARPQAHRDCGAASARASARWRAPAPRPPRPCRAARRPLAAPSRTARTAPPAPARSPAAPPACRPARPPRRASRSERSPNISARLMMLGPGSTCASDSSLDELLLVQPALALDQLALRHRAARRRSPAVPAT